MDAFLDICLGIGLALAAGLVIGVILPPIMPTWGVLLGATPLGVLACAAALGPGDVPVVLALLIGALSAGLAALVARDVGAGAARREGEPGARNFETQLEQPSAALTALIVLAAVAVALLSLLFPPISLVAVVGLAYLYWARSRREARKHEGLRVLR
jgi:hypothetical protein